MASTAEYSSGASYRGMKYLIVKHVGEIRKLLMCMKNILKCHQFCLKLGPSICLFYIYLYSMYVFQSNCIICLTWFWRKNFMCFLYRMWEGFLASNLSSADLLLFAFYMFFIAPNDLRMSLIKHLLSDPTGATMIRTYITVLWMITCSVLF